MSGSAVERFERCLVAGGIALFPADTVYGLACDPSNREAVERLYSLKSRPLTKPSAVMFFDLELALAALDGLGPRTRAALTRLLPGGVSLLLPNPAGQFQLACGEDPGTLGLRVPEVPQLANVRRPVLQSSANQAGGKDPRTLEEVPEFLHQAADLVIDGGELPGTPSTVVDLRRYEELGKWTVIREGAVSRSDLEEALAWQFHFDPATYAEMIREEVPGYQRLQAGLAMASGTDARRILELGTGTGETTRRLLDRHPNATLVGIDASEEMLEAARERLRDGRSELRVARLEDPLPEGPFDLVASALCVHHLQGRAKAELFGRVRDALAAGGRFVLADVVVPEDPADAVTPLSDGYDYPSSAAEQLEWLREAGFDAELRWAERDLAVVAAIRPK